MIEQQEREEIERGIAAYARERAILKRWIRMRGELTETRFDSVLYGRGMRPSKLRFAGGGISGDSFLLGGLSFSDRDKWLELLQIMCALGEVDTATKDGEVVYSLKKAQIEED